jgi:hypothetical protein|tara:strand:- start:379 stop:549 length:171 start_codon:yes stop_codon:yes gene_type:complete
LAITNKGGFAAKSDAKALALSPPKMKTAWAINAANTRSFGMEAKPQWKSCRCDWPG